MRYQSNTTIKKVTIGPKVEYSGLKSEREFLSLDPLADKFPGWSPYSYVMNNPVRLTDPTGMEPCTDCPKNAKKGDTYDHTEYGKLEFNGDSWSNDEYGMILNDANITAKQSSSTGFDIKSSISKGILLGGTVTGGLEASIYTSNSFTGEEIWHGKTTGKFYSSQDFHPNNYVMNQSKAMARADSRFFRVGAQSMFFIGSGLTLMDMRENPTPSNISLGLMDIGMGYVGTYGGPIGLGVSLTYTTSRLSIDAFSQGQKAGITQTNPNQTFNYIGGLAPAFYITK